MQRKIKEMSKGKRVHSAGIGLVRKYLPIIL
jgi:hypothetical protein